MEIPKEAAGSKPTRLCLVRHGETEWNTQRRIQGWIDIGLNDNGIRQAEAAGRWLADCGISALYTSDLLRARTTAGCIGAALGLEPRLAPELRERCYGVFEGLTYDEAQTRYPETYDAFERRDPDLDFETGESLRTFHDRVAGKLNALAAAHPGENIVVVLHGGVLDIANRLVRGNSLEAPRDFLIPNAGLNWITWADGQWSIDSWGETSHLQSGALDELPT